MSPCASIRGPINGDRHSRDLRADVASHRARRGVTLVELLVVIALIVMVTAAAIPVMAPAIQSRRVREASRLVSSYLAAARSRAIQTGRPVGVVVNGFTSGLASSSNPINNGATTYAYSMSLSMAESQPPYAGDTTNSTAYVAYNSATNNNSQTYYYLQINGFPNDAVGNQRIQTGDRIRLNYQGPYFYIVNPSGGYVGNNVSTSNPLYLYPYSETSTSLGSYSPATYLPPPYIPLVQSLQTNGGNGLPLPYQILRQPVRSSVDPLQLPEGIVIDLQWSGMSTGSSGVANSSGGYNSGVFSGLASPIISFGPNGSVDMLYDNGTQHASGPIYLLLGRNEQVNPPVANSQNNLGDLNSIWVAVNNQTGQVSTSQNYNPTFAQNAGHVGMNAFSTTPSADIITARTLASGSAGPVTTQGGN